MLMLCRRQEAMATADNDSIGVGMTIIAASFCQPDLSAPRAETVRVHLHESDPAQRHDHHPTGNEHRLDGRVLFARADWTRVPRYLEQALALRSFISATVGVPGPSTSTEPWRPVDLGHGRTLMSVCRRQTPPGG